MPAGQTSTWAIAARFSKISQSLSSSDVDAGSPNVDVGDRRASFEESASSNANKSNITPEQLERMERNREEAQRKKMARLSASSDVGGGCRCG
jgi:hypothetical protein